MRSSTAALAAAVSAVSGEGTQRLLELMADTVDDAPEIEACVPAGQGEALAWLYQHGRVVERRDEADGSVMMTVRLDDQALGRFRVAVPRGAVA